MAKTRAEKARTISLKQLSSDKGPKATEACLARPQHVPSTDEEWVRFTDDLALCLSDLDEDDFFVLSYKRATYYVQFAAQGRFGMRVEATCNAYIDEPGDQLSDEDCAAMAQLGWRNPTKAPSKRSKTRQDPDGSPNFFRDLPYPVDFEGIAKIAVETLRKVYHVSHPGMMKYKAFGHDGPSIRFPSLRLQRDNS